MGNRAGWILIIGLGLARTAAAQAPAAPDDVLGLSLVVGGDAWAPVSFFALGAHVSVDRVEAGNGIGADLAVGLAPFSDYECGSLLPASPQAVGMPKGFSVAARGQARLSTDRSGWILGVKGRIGAQVSDVCSTDLFGTASALLEVSRQVDGVTLRTGLGAFASVNGNLQPFFAPIADFSIEWRLSHDLRPSLGLQYGAAGLGLTLGVGVPLH